MSSVFSPGTPDPILCWIAWRRPRPIPGRRLASLCGGWRSPALFERRVGLLFGTINPRANYRQTPQYESSREEVLTRYELCCLSSPPPALPSSAGSAGYFYLGAN